MNKDKRQTPFVNVGSSLLLVVFLLLCLMTFAALSFSSAQNDESFSQRIAVRKTEYYEAANQAEKLLRQIDGILSVVISSDKPKESLNNLDFSEIDSIDADIDLELEESTISYQVPINDKQALEVILELNDINSASETSYYTIKKWQTVTTRKWENDNKLKLMPIP